MWSALACAFAAPFNACSATMLADVIPRGKEYVFFALFALVSKSTAWIGPIVAGVIIDRSGSTWTGFPFSLALTAVGLGVIWTVDVDEAKRQCDSWAVPEEEAGGSGAPEPGPASPPSASSGTVSGG